MINYRKPLHDKLITDFTALKHIDASSSLFANVKKIYLNLPTSTPACRIIQTAPAVEVLGNTSDIRSLGFQADIYELIEASASEAEAVIKIDRLSNIEDQVYAYLEELPNNLEHAITSIHVFELHPQPAIYNYVQAEQGIEVYLTIPFELKILITPQLL